MGHTQEVDSLIQLLASFVKGISGLKFKLFIRWVFWFKCIPGTNCIIKMLSIN